MRRERWLQAGVVHPADKLTDDEKISLVRDLDAEYAKARTLIPRSKKPLSVNADGTWDKAEWQKTGQSMGAAARLGDQVQITKVSLEGDKLVLELNGGLKSGNGRVPDGALIEPSVRDGSDLP